MSMCINLIERYELILNEMAFNREKWIDRVRDNVLSGALGEYAKMRVALSIGEDDNWSNEIKNLLNKLDFYLSKNVKTKTKFNKEKAFKEAYIEASLEQKQITDAKNEMIKYYPNKRKEILKIDFNSIKLIEDMLTEFKPKYIKLI